MYFAEQGMHKQSWFGQSLQNVTILIVFISILQFRIFLYFVYPRILTRKKCNVF